MAYMQPDERLEAIRRKCRRGLERYGVELANCSTVKLATLPSDPIERQICKGLETVLWASYEMCARSGKVYLDRIDTSQPDPAGRRIGLWDVVKALSVLSEVIGQLEAVSASVRYLGDLRDWRGEILAWIRESIWDYRERDERTTRRTLEDGHDNPMVAEVLRATGDES